VLNKIDDSVYTTLIIVFIDLVVAFILLLGQKKKKRDVMQINRLNPLIQQQINYLC